MQVKVVQIVKLDAFSSEIRVIDSSNEVWNFQILNNKFKHLSEGQYIRVRQATLQNHKKYSHVFGIKGHTNIMTLPNPCKIASEMFMAEDKACREYEGDQIKHLLTVGLLEHPIVVSKVETSNAPMVSLASVVEAAAKNKTEEFKVRFMVN